MPVKKKVILLSALRITSPKFFRIVEEKPIESGKYKVLIVAIPEVGLVSILVARKLIKDLKMERVGFVFSEPTSILIRFENRKPQPVIRLFARDDILLLLYEAPIDPLMMIPLANLIIKLIDEKNIDLPIMLASAPSQARMAKSDSEISVIGAPVGDYAIKALEKANIQFISNGTLSGPFAYVLNDRLVKNKSGLVLLSETFPTPFAADPASAAKLLEALAKILNREEEIDTRELLERAEEIRLEMRKLEKAVKAQLPKEISELYT
mgnify:CR=1 FL=1